MYHKSLSPDQMNILLSKDDSSNLLWISFACDELRYFGIFEQVTAFIQSLPKKLDLLLVKYLFFFFFIC